MAGFEDASLGVWQLQPVKKVSQSFIFVMAQTYFWYRNSSTRFAASVFFLQNNLSHWDPGDLPYIFPIRFQIRGDITTEHESAVSAKPLVQHKLNISDSADALSASLRQHRRRISGIGDNAGGVLTARHQCCLRHQTRLRQH